MLIEQPSSLAARIAAAAKASGIQPTTFCAKHFNNQRLHERLCGGGSVRPDTYRRIVELIGTPSEPKHPPYDQCVDKCLRPVGSDNITANQPQPSDLDAPSSEKQPTGENTKNPCDIIETGESA